ncbi:MAG: hypothetical protein QME42_11780 [bacterium]|nr:hypothetical protein [bacterium]
MAVIELSKDVIGLFDYIDGNTTTEKIVNLMDADLTQKLHECEDEIYKFEVKYRMSFAEFKESWEKGKIPNRYSYSVERDYMMWEGLETEKKKWLSLMNRVGREREN